MKYIFVLVTFLITWDALATGCHSIHLQGTLPDHGTTTLYSSALTSISSAALLTEAGRDHNDGEKKKAALLGLGVSAFYLYFAGVMNCRQVSKEEYDKLALEKIRLIKAGEEDMPYEARFLVPVPSREEIIERHKYWRRLKKLSLFLVGGLNLTANYFVVRVADTTGVKAMGVVSTAATIALGIIDLDNIWGEGPLKGINLDVLPAKVADKWEPSLHVGYRF